MAIREKLSYANTEHHKAITSMDKIIRGAVLMKWMYLLATIFYIIFGAYFLFMVYPEIQFMLVILGVFSLVAMLSLFSAVWFK